MFSFFSFLWKNKVAVLVGLVGLALSITLGVKLYQSRSVADSYADQLQDFAVVTRLNESAFMQATASVELQDSLIDGLGLPRDQSVAYAADVRIVYATRTVRVPVVERVAVVDDDLITARIEVLDGPGCIDGFCRVKDPEVEMTYTLKPLVLDLFVTKRNGRYQTVVDTHNPDLTVEMTTRLDPSVFADGQKRGFLGVGPLIRLRRYRDDFNVGDVGAVVLGGYAGDKFFVGGQVQYLQGFAAGVMAGGRF